MSVLVLHTTTVGGLSADGRILGLAGGSRSDFRTLSGKSGPRRDTARYIACKPLRTVNWSSRSRFFSLIQVAENFRFCSSVRYTIYLERNSAFLSSFWLHRGFGH